MRQEGLPPDWIEAALDDGSLVLGRTGSRRLLLLNPVAAFVWEARKAALSALETSELLAARLPVPGDEIIGDVRRTIESFESLEGHFDCDLFQPPVGLPGKAAQTLLESACSWSARLRLAGQNILLRVEDGQLAGSLKPILQHLQADDALHTTELTLAGTLEEWELSRDGRVCEPVDAHPVVNTIHQLVEAACCSEQHLLTVHGAAVSTDKAGVLLIGTGGSGKTTLAVALNARGFTLMSDDVVPVSHDGRLLPVGISPCLKEGSWEVLGPSIPTLADQPITERFGQSVRFIPPPGNVAFSPRPTSLFLFPQYRPGSGLESVELDHAQILQGLVDSESLIPDLNQQRLDRMLAWLSSAPAYRIRYSEIAGGVALVEDLMKRHVH